MWHEMANRQPRVVYEDSCFNKGTIVYKLLESNGHQIGSPIPIENIIEGDFVLSQVNGKFDFAEVFLVRAHKDYEGEIIKFVLEDDQSLEVTADYCMPVSSDEEEGLIGNWGE